MINLKINDQIKPYFNYYERLYKPELLGDCIFIEIPMMDGCAALDNYYIKPLLENGFKYESNWLLSQIYLIKTF